MADTDTASEPAAAPQVPGFSKKAMIIIALVTAAVWWLAIASESLVLQIIVGVLTVALVAILVYAFRMIRKQRGMLSMMQGAGQSPEARQAALAKLAEGKDADTPTNVFLRAQLLAQDKPKEALALLEPVALKEFPPTLQDDVSLLKTQLYLGFGRTADARKAADSMNLDNPQRQEQRPIAATIVTEAWARTGKPKEALTLLDSIQVPKKDAEQLLVQARVARIFARFATGQRNVARTELVALADEDVNYLSRFLLPQFKVHPELQQLARKVFEQHPSARRQAKSQARKQR